ERGDASVRTAPVAGAGELGVVEPLVATRCRNRRLPIPGLDLPGVLSLREAPDADVIKEAAVGGGRAVVVGMGFIGAEVAASLRSHGVEVVAIEPQETPLLRVVGPEIGS